jgi:hypothetical protein
MIFERPFPRRLDLLHKMVELEEDVRYQEMASEGEPEIAIERGRGSILLSAPHGAVHCRKGKLKNEDEFTVAMVRMVARLTGVHVIYARRRSDSDPNWYSDAPYKAILKTLIAEENISFVLDFHGSSAKRSFGIGIGTLHGQSCAGSMDIILNVLGAHRFSNSASTRLERLDIDQTFPAVGAGNQETVTRFVWERLRIPAVQLEFNASLRTVREKPDSSYLIRRLGSPFVGQPVHIERTMQALTSLVRVLGTSPGLS